MATESDQLNLKQPDQVRSKEVSGLVTNGEMNGCSGSNSIEASTPVNNSDQRTDQEESVNCDLTKTEDNLIDLDSPISDTFNAFLSCRLIERARERNRNTDAVNKELNSNSLQGEDNNSVDQNMHVSHTESGYLTDSVTSNSTIGNERHESLSSGSDRTPCLEQAPSETDVLLRHSSCKEGSTVCNNCIAGSSGDDCDKSRPTSTSSAKAFDLINALDNLKELKDLDLGTDVKLKTGPRKLIDLDNIFAKCDSNEIQPGPERLSQCDSNEVQPRPESLLLPRPLQSSERPHSKSDAGSAVPAHVFEEERMERKRSKSSGFPIPRVKEGVDISDEGLSKSLPHGMIMRKGDMIEFIADDLQEMIRRSSPMSKTGTYQLHSSR